MVFPVGANWPDFLLGVGCCQTVAPLAPPFAPLIEMISWPFEGLQPKVCQKTQTSFIPPIRLFANLVCWMFFFRVPVFVLTPAFSPGRSSRNESARAAFTFRYLNRTFLIPPPPTFSGKHTHLHPQVFPAHADAISCHPSIVDLQLRHY